MKGLLITFEGAEGSGKSTQISLARDYLKIAGKDAVVIREPGGSVFVYDTTSVERIFDARLSYSKGAILLHMLRWEMGDEPFFRALNNYLYDPLLANGYARTDDLIRHLEAAADTTFTEFLNDWLYGEGFPTYTIEVTPPLHLTPSTLDIRHSTLDPPLVTSYELQVTVYQETSHPSVDFFEMHVPIRVFGGGSYRDFRLKHEYSGQSFLLDPGFPVERVEFDPDRWICTANPVITGVEELRVAGEIELFPNPAGDELFVKIPAGVSGSLQIIDIHGRTVWETEVVDNGHPAGAPLVTGDVIRVNTSAFKNGMYIMKIGDVKKSLVVIN